MPAPVDMGGYADYSMVLPDGEAAAGGICHRRGPNENLPAQGLIYIRVTDLDKSIAACSAGGGKVTVGPKNMGESMRYSIIADPAGAVCALFQMS